jgi:hypothetical protein
MALMNSVPCLQYAIPVRCNMKVLLNRKYNQYIVDSYYEPYVSYQYQ